MAYASWMAVDRALSPVALTRRAQVVLPTDPGRLGWPEFFPIEDVAGTDVQDITAIDYRPVSERREWDGQGREIPLRTPTLRPVKITPVEAKNTINEEEMGRLKTQAGGNDAVFRDVMGVTVPRRVTMLAMANFRRLEVEAMSAWANGTVTQRMPEDPSKTYTINYNFDASHYVTASTAWDDVLINAYDTFIATYFAAQDVIGPVRAVMLRQNIYNAILADAPDLPNGVLMTRTSLEQRIEQDTRNAIQIIINENTAHVFTTGGPATTTTKVWPTGKCAFIPADGIIGAVLRAPVVRNMDLVAQVGPNRVDERGQSIFYVDVNDGKGLRIECQINALPVPFENKLYVVATGVA
jgi:hypothetical protein